MGAWSTTIRIAKLGIALSCLLALPACTQQSVSGKTVIRIAGWGVAGGDSDAARIEREIFAEFERQNPDVEIQLENIPGSQDYVRKVLLSYIAHSEPDIIRLDASSAAIFVENGVLRDLTPYIENDPNFDLGDFYPNVVDIGRRGDALYAIPIDFTPLVVYYNKRLFDESGIPYPEPGWTWDDFLTKAKALTKEGKYGYTFSNWMPGWLPWLWNNGGDVIGPDGKALGTANSDATVEGVEWLRDLVNVHKVAPSLSQMAAEGAALFANGQAAMETSGHWNINSLASAPGIEMKEVGIAPLPVSQKGQEPVTVIYESGWAIGKNCKHPEIAWKFISYYTSAEVQRKLQSTGIGVCARKDIAQERAVDAREQEFIRIIPSGREPWGAKIEGYNFVESEGQKAMDSVLKSNRDPRRAFTEFAKAVDRQLEKE